MSQLLDQRALLSDARDKARRLLDDLLRQQGQLSHPFSRIDATQLAEGHRTLGDAIAAAQAALAGLEAALAEPPSLSSSDSLGRKPAVQ